MSYTTWDIETSIYTSFKRKANPFDARNWVVTHAFKKHKGGGVVERRYGSKRPPAGWFKEVLDGTRILIGQNIKFDLLHALQDTENLEAWMDWVANGGHLWDIQLAEYLLCGMDQANHMLSLDEIAPRYGGNVKVDEVKALWDAGVQTHEIEPALLTRYLCGGPDETGTFQLGDVENTEKVAFAQMRRAKEAGQLQSILLNMGSLICTIEMERNGMFVDKPQGLVLAAALSEKVTELRLGLEQYLPKDLPFPFKWTSRYHKSALLFGGTVQYESREWQLKDETWTYDSPALPDGPRQNFEQYAYSQMDATHYLLKDGTTTPHAPMDGDHAALSYESYKSGKNAGELKTKKVKLDDYSRPKSRLCKRPYTFAGFTKPDRRWKTSEEGVWSTSSEVIEELGERNVPFLKIMASLQKTSKDLGTYFIVVAEDGTETGMLALVDLNGIIHHKVNHTSTVTGRFSSSDPNLQNIPKGNKSDVKTIFVSRFGPDGVVCQSDFSSLEVYVQAILTGCLQLIEDLKAGLDLHCVRLAAKEHMEYDEVLKLAKGYRLPDGTKVDAVKEWDYKRTGAKVYSFQRAFGAGIKKIAASTGMTEEETQALADAEDARYPEINPWYEGVTEKIKLGRKPSGYAVPHPDVNGVMCHLGVGSYRTPDGKLYTYREQPSPEYLVKRGVYSSFSPTEIKNYVVQGSGGEWAKAAMTLAVRSFYARRNFGHKALLVNQVHDALYGDFHPDVKREAAALLHACMEAASDYMEYLFDWPVPVPVPSDTTWGLSMMDEDSIDGLTELAGQLRVELRNEYMGGYTPSFVH